MIKKVSKIIILSLLILSTLLISTNYATEEKGKGKRPSDMMNTINRGQTTSEGLFSDMKGAAEDFLQTGKEGQQITAQTAKEQILPIANILVGIATVVFLIVGGYLGLQYMLNGANERAQLKQKLIWFVIAVVVVYGATGIFNIAVSIMTSITGE